MSKPKILFILHLPPPVHGAAMMGSFIKNSALVNEEIDSFFVNLSTTKKLDETGKGGLGKAVTFLKMIASVFSALSQKRWDACYMTLTSSGAGFYKDLVIVALIKLFGVKLVYHFHNKGVANASASVINRLLYQFVFKNTKTILLSPHLYPDIRNFVKEENVFYCPNGIPLVTNIRHKQMSEQGVCELLYLSNMLQEKGAYVLLDALIELKKRGILFKANFVGGWSDITESEFNNRIVNAGLTDMAIAHGPKYGSDKDQFWNAADVFIFPTFYHYEAFPLVLLEAMQHQLPIISTTEGGIPDIVLNGETGFLVPQKNAAALADQLEILIKNPELRMKMGALGKERFNQHFTLSHFEKQMVSILKQVTIR
ncbi:glycosyltransferase family 4 protein [Dyadobacter luticola]|uniref:glycosyltransferase family 4 protein n=1 Tax=Dyadobacter luticola TaxID=1979387 RepID=UPI00197AAA46|nr:glycosyltransferase family 4 protein [Dyadobacter luticola]